jgi:hypothetical protein
MNQKDKIEKEIQKLKQVISKHKTSKIIKDGKSKNKSLVNLGTSNFIKSGNSITRISLDQSSGRSKTVTRSSSGRAAAKTIQTSSKNKTLVKDSSGNFSAIGKHSLKKKKYCQFYRFGKCAKRKCRYIHDSSRISPCPKYLQGLECNNCKLNHELTPCITPNCKFFLIGNCTKKGCRFLHLKKDGGKICPDFADNGYCYKGSKCINLHVFSCPRFEKDGKCSKRGCKLKHSLPLTGDEEMPIMPDFNLQDSDSDTSAEQVSAKVSEEEESELEIF